MSSGFVSESDLAERRRVQKEIWQTTKGEDDPEEPPEEPAPDHRTLYERLKEQKDKKQEDWEEAHKLKNMVKGLEDDEVDFLELVDNTKIQEEKRIKAEEQSAIQEYRKKVSAMQQKALESEVLTELKPETKRSSGHKKSSQTSLLAGAIKRKRSETETDEEPKTSKAKVKIDPENNVKCEKSSLTEESKTSLTEVSKASSAEPSKPSSTEQSKVSPPTEQPTASAEKLQANRGVRCVAVLPGLGVYTDSSDSENDSNSDSDLEVNAKDGLPRDLTGRLIQFHSSAGGKGCC